MTDQPLLIPILIPTNSILAALSSGTLDMLQPHLERFDLIHSARLSYSGKPITHIYFPLSGMISLVHTYSDGATMEVGLIGREGFWGTSVVLGVTSSPIEAMVQGEGTALRIAVPNLLAVAFVHPDLRQILLHYAHFLYVQAALTAACNGLHNVNQRLMRWLLEAEDRLGIGPVSITHESLSYMLGIRRAGVTEALGELADQDIVTIGRGKISIKNRAAIESKTCHCYRIVKDEYRHVGEAEVASNH